MLIVYVTEMLAQPMTLDQAIKEAKTNSVPALQAKASFVSDYWAWRSFLGSRLPSASLYGTLGSYNRSRVLLQNYDTGVMQYASANNLQNSLGIRLRQNVTLTGGTVSLFSDLRRIDQFGISSARTWFSQPLTFSYSQPLFSFNQFKWDRIISPKEYEASRRKYLEALEDVALSVVRCYFSLMLASRTLDVSVENYDNTARMLRIARDRFSIGSVTRDEILQLELRILNDSISISDNEVSLREARMSLNSLLGLDESVSVIPKLEEDLPSVSMDYEFVLAKASENASFNLDNEISQLSADAAIAQAKASRGLTMQLNATFGLSKDDRELRNVYNGLLDQEIVGLSFSIPIFDWGEGKGKVKKAEAAAEVVRAEVEQAENDYRIRLFTSVGQFNNQRQLCDISRRASEIAHQRYALVMDRFSSGAATVTELNTARNESDSALQKYITDIWNYWNYYYTLRRLTLYDFISGADLDVDYGQIVD